jgi:hypothetical protein
MCAYDTPYDSALVECSLVCPMPSLIFHSICLLYPVWIRLRTKELACARRKQLVASPISTLFVRFGTYGHKHGYMSWRAVPLRSDYKLVFNWY